MALGARFARVLARKPYTAAEIERMEEFIRWLRVVEGAQDKQRQLKEISREARKICKDLGI